MVTVTLLSSLLFSSALSCVISSLPVVPISLLCYRICHAGERLRRTVNVNRAGTVVLQLLWRHGYSLWRRGRSGIFGVGYNDIKSWWLVVCGTDDINLPGAYHPRVCWWNMPDRLEHAVNILVILQVACVLRLRSLTPVTYLCKLLGIHSLVAFLQLELFRVYPFIIFLRTSRCADIWSI